MCTSCQQTPALLFISKTKHTEWWYMTLCADSSTVPSSSLAGVFTTSVPTTTASAASFPEIWRPSLQVTNIWSIFNALLSLVANTSVRQRVTKEKIVLKIFTVIQRTKNTLRNIAGRRCGTWKKTTTTKGHAKSATRRTTCTRGGSVNASGSSGTFLLPLTRTLHLLAHLQSSDGVVRRGPLCSASVWMQAVKAPVKHKRCWLDTPQLFRHTVTFTVCLPLQSNSTPGFQVQLSLAVKVMSFVF